MPSIWEILGWLLYGAVRYVMLWIPLITPFRVDISIPVSWWRYCTWDDWGHKDDNNGGPDEHWLNCWFSMAIGEFKRSVLKEADDLIASARQYLLGLIGGVQAGIGSLGGWAQKLDDWIGGFVPGWAGTVSNGLEWLRNKLPAWIRDGWGDWSSLWESIKLAVKDWARDRYDDFRGWALGAWDWVLDQGQVLAGWRDSIASWLDAFQADPYGVITGWLGSAWAWLLEFRDRGKEQILDWLGDDMPKLLVFARDCVDFYWSLWDQGWRELGEFVADPRAWLVDRLEGALADRW